MIRKTLALAATLFAVGTASADAHLVTSWSADYNVAKSAARNSCGSSAYWYCHWQDYGNTWRSGEHTRRFYFYGSEMKWYGATRNCGWYVYVTHGNLWSVNKWCYN